MKTKEVTIAGKQVTLAYCYATEIGFRGYTGQDISDYISECQIAVNSGQMPDTQKSIYLVLAAIVAYNESQGIKAEDAAVTDSDLIYHAKPAEVASAIATIVTLYSEWYEIPNDEPKNKEPQKGTKKRKNA